ncbi:MAG: InlB B-repeat-containing protein, partial [Oscillospiraceae bacterium]|nr:InlB B-repeat-containing protein [Oscillospiraceae bacterium]
MKKKIHDLLAVVLTLCIALNLFSVPALAAGSGTKDAPWDISETAGTDSVTAWYENNGQSGCTLHIEGSGRMTASFRDVATPWAGIKQNITKVVVEEGVTNIGAYALSYCRKLSSAALPESLTEIGTYAFHATGIKRLTIPAGVDTIGRMIATPNTYYVVLGNPRNVNDHAFSTSLVSAADKASAVSLNSKTNVSAIIVLDGGIYGETDEDLANLSYGLIDPVKEGYTFKGWYRDDGFTLTCKVSEDGRTIININNIYYAKWTAGGTEPPAPAEYTVTFDSQGGSAIASQAVVGGGTATKPADPTRTSYTFGGWFTDAVCTMEWDFGTAVTEDITLYAKWTAEGTEPPAPAEYTVTFDSQGGSTIAGQTVVGGGTAAKPADPTHTGYTFGGWFTDVACTMEWDFGTAVTKDITLYAKWT